MEELTKYLEADSIKQLTTEELENIFRWMVLELGTLRNELNDRLKKSVSKDEIRKYLLEAAQWNESKKGTRRVNYPPLN